MNGYAQDTGILKMSEDFLRATENLSNNFELMVNPPEVNQYSLKDVQKSVLPLPFIPAVEPENRKDLESVLKSGQKVVAKPRVGHRGEGIVFLDSPNQVPEYFHSCERLRDYCFEKFVADRIETRYFILDGKIHDKIRIRCMEGDYGDERISEIYILEPYNKSQIETVENLLRSPIGRRIVYGSVDFRGDDVLEFNGSGTGCLYGTTKDDGSYSDINLDITSEIVDTIENKCWEYQEENFPPIHTDHLYHPPLEVVGTIGNR